MKIIIVGASGKIGQEISALLEPKHEIIKVGRRSGDIQSDYTDPESVAQMFAQVGAFDALISVAGGDSQFKKFESLTDSDYRYGFERKFLSQVRLLNMGLSQINDGGSFVFSSGYLSDYPNAYSIATGPFNAAIDAFAQNVAPILPRGVRVNVVSPAPVVETEQVKHGLVSAAQAAQSYVKTVLADGITGKVVRAWGGLENDPLPSAS